ncbi:MAG: T9SS type B sorting domain-containing protein [Saprospiraceae bacterium]|nr:T9SS type B sorting domain-containing protein [Saprospiraceae bacterium]
MNKIYALLTCALMSIELIGAQCCIDPNLIIKDESSQTVRFKISGSAINDLSDPRQGVCKVSVKFKHDYIGDLKMTLVSPSGQSVDLIGPTCPTTTTQNTSFDVSFVKCSVLPNPDPGFLGKWSNCQKWGILGNKTGIYHPSLGCLEDFNTGTVNGTWTLLIKDEEYFYEGVLERFCLEFCDKSGILCNPCDANAGSFDKNFLTYKFCKGDPNLIIQQKPIINGVPTNPLLYGYKYYVAENDKIIDFTSSLDMSKRPAGIYSICGVSYLLQDSTNLPKVGNPLSFSKISSDLQSGKFGICAELTSNCITVIINEIPKTTDLNIKICAKDTFRIGAKSFYATGVYKEVLQNENGCDSIINLNLSLTPLIVTIDPVQDLNCGRSNVVIDASKSSVPTNSTIKWITFDGNIVDITADSLKVTVNKRGSYKLVISNNNCADSLLVDIQNSTNVPELSIIRDTITCFKPNVTIKATTNKGGVTWKWLNDIGTTIGTNSDQLIGISGKYSVIVTDGNGCTNIISFRVPENKTLPKFSLSSTSITCRIDTAILKVKAASLISSYVWNKNNVFVSSDSIVTVVDTGIYTITAIGPNGCPLTKTLEVQSLIKKPDFRATVNEITCKDTVVRIRPVINVPLKLLEYYRNLPDTFYAKVFDPQVRKPGKYNVRVVDTADCVLDTFVEVFENVERAKFTLSAKNLACNDDSVQIHLMYLSNPGNQIDYNWIGPIGFSSVIQDPWARERGIFKVSVTLPNGCVTIDSILVEEDTTRPRIQMMTDSLTCIKNKARITTQVKDAVKYSWEGPNNFKSDSANLEIFEEGFYKLTVTASNGCTSERTAEVVKDTLPPFSSFKLDTLNCLKPQIILKPNYNVAIDSVHWSLNNSTFSIDSTPVTSTPGLYTLYGQGKNGCITSDTMRVLIDTVRTPMVLLSDTLTCLKKSAQIGPDPIIGGTIYRWATPWKDTLFSPALSIENGGTYYLQVTEKNGCITELKGEVVALTNPPKVNFSVDTITCRNPIAKITSNSTDNNLKYYWFKADSTDTDSVNLFTQIPGKYYVTVTNEYGCELEKVLDIKSFIKVLKFNFTDTFFNCNNKNLNFIDFNTSDILSDFYWISPARDTIRSKRVNNVLGGDYQFHSIDPNGCEFRKRVQIIYDTIPPLFTAFSIDTVNCINKTLGSNIKLLDNTATVSWTGLNPIFNSTVLNPVFPAPGQYTLSIQNRNFCKKDTTISIIVDTILPQFIILADSITCKNSRSTVKVESPDKNLIIKWVNLSTFDTTTINPLKSITGDRYKVIVLNPFNKCELSRDHQVVIFKEPPVVEVNNFTLRCAEDSIEIFATSSCSPATYFWRTPSNQVIDSIARPHMRDTGKYELTFVCEATGCDTNIVFYIDRKDVPPVVSYKTDELSCKKDSIYITLTTGVTDTLFEWKGPNNFVSTEKNPVITSPGQYIIKVSNSFGCSKDTTITIGIDSLSPQISLLQLDTLRCDSNTVRILAIDNSILNPKTYSWTSSDGTIANAIKDKAIVTKEGTYRVTVRDTVNGCITIKDLQVVESSDPIDASVINSKGISCPGRTDGKIEIRNVFGGSPSYQYSINNGGYSQNTEFAGLAPDVYTIRIKDKWGCRYDTSVVVADKAPLELEILRDTVISSGESVKLQILTNVKDIFSSEWTPSDNLSCDNCIDPIASPLATQTYELVLIDSNGCEVRDRVTIEVLTDLNIFIPTVFSPNGDGINDVLDLIAQKGIVLIESYRVYDRWGALVFEKSNFDPSTSNHGWNGSFNGQILNPGVYIYQIVGRSKIGDKVSKFGDVTLLR